jgi:hypothetical protein
MPGRTYADYLRSPHWRRVRQQYRESDRPQECICGETDGLELHHLTYERLGRERLTDLRFLCGPCHDAVHVLEKRGDIGLDLAGLTSEQRAKRYNAGRAEARQRASDEFDVEEPLSEMLRRIEPHLRPQQRGMMQRLIGKARRELSLT